MQENTHSQEQQEAQEQAKRGRGRPRKDEKQYGSVCIYISREAIDKYGSLANARRAMRQLVIAALQQAPQTTT